ncbi:hypothetical protein [Streptomyces atratus]|nr:hypothetical protein [Streptomyces atratus]MCX5339735.1 hypothetical protein [Streptomyces atratus]
MNLLARALEVRRFAAFTVSRQSTLGDVLKFPHGRDREFMESLKDAEL